MLWKVDFTAEADDQLLKDEYQRTKSKPKTLSFTFWSVLCIKHPELVSAPELPELMSISGLARVYRFTQEALEAAIKPNG